MTHRGRRTRTTANRRPPGRTRSAPEEPRAVLGEEVGGVESGPGVTPAGDPFVELRVPVLQGGLGTSEARVAGVLLVENAARAEMEAAVVAVLRDPTTGGGALDDRAIAAFVMAVRAKVAERRRVS